MKTLKSKLQGIGMMLLFTFVTIQTMSASALAGEYKVNEGYTVTIALADPYKRTLMQSTGVTCSWYSENNSYATVVSSTRYNATVKGVKSTSSCKVYFKCSYFIDGYYRTMDFYYDIQVVGTNVSVTSVSLSQSSASIKEGNTLQLSANVYPTNATNRNVNWSSSNTSVATVSSYGLITAKSAGSATITCRASDGSGKYATCIVTVKGEVLPTSIAISKPKETLTAGETLQLTATVSPDQAADNSALTWMSDNKDVATVSSNGLVTAKSAGVANIIVITTNNLAAVCTITVKEQTTGVQVNQEELAVKICNGTIVLNEAADVNVYRMNGTMVFSGKVQTIEGLDKGFYIVRIGSRSKKVIL